MRWHNTLWSKQALTLPVHRTYCKDKQLVRNNWRQKLWQIQGHSPNSSNFFTDKVFNYMVICKLMAACTLLCGVTGFINYSFNQNVFGCLGCCCLCFDTVSSTKRESCFMDQVFLRNFLLWKTIIETKTFVCNSRHSSKLHIHFVKSISFNNTRLYRTKERMRVTIN